MKTYAFMSKIDEYDYAKILDSVSEDTTIVLVKKPGIFELAGEDTTHIYARRQRLRDAERLGIHFPKPASHGSHTINDKWVQYVPREVGSAYTDLVSQMSDFVQRLQAAESDLHVHHVTYV